MSRFNIIGLFLYIADVFVFHSRCIETVCVCVYTVTKANFEFTSRTFALLYTFLHDLYNI